MQCLNCSISNLCRNTILFHLPGVGRTDRGRQCRMKACAHDSWPRTPIHDTSGPGDQPERPRPAKGVLIMMDVRFPALLAATLLERPNRFLLRALVEGRPEMVASRDPG